MVDALSGSRIHTTHKTYKNKLYSNTNITGLWEKISESFHVHSDRHSSEESESTHQKLSQSQVVEKSDKTERNIECIYRSCGQRETCDTCNSAVALSDEVFLVCINPIRSII